MNRKIETILRLFDNEDRELVLRFRLWRDRWFGTQVAELQGMTDGGELILGPWEKRPPTARLLGHTLVCQVWRGLQNQCNCSSNTTIGKSVPVESLLDEDDYAIMEMDRDEE